MQPGEEQQREQARAQVHARAARAAERTSPLARAGHLLFRWRSLTPVPLLAVALPWLWSGRGPSHPLWLWSGLAACALGQVLRAWVLGQVQDGTSGQNELLIATALNQRGPYAHVRNPLYVGNLGITAGLCLAAHEPLLLAAVTGLFALQYAAILSVEEAFLRERFGAVYLAYCARVPRFLPRLRAAPPPEDASQPASPAIWSWRRALRKEHNPLASWLLLALMLDGLDRLAPDLARGSTLGQAARGLEAHAAAAAIVLAAWLAVKAWKHSWLSGGLREDLARRVRTGLRR
jgi:protein-S-isoprenylcysteine O-methyltransferase Ste14